LAGDSAPVPSYLFAVLHERASAAGRTGETHDRVEFDPVVRTAALTVALVEEPDADDAIGVPCTTI